MKERTSQQSDIPHTPLRYFWYVVKPNKWWWFGALAAVMFAASLMQGTSYLFKLIVDAVEAGDPTAAMWYALLYPTLVFVGQLLYRLSGVMGGTLITRSFKRSYDLLAEHVVQHSYSYFTNRFAGSLLSKTQHINNAIERISEILLWGQIPSILSLIITLVFLLMIDWQAALAFFSMIVVLVILNRFLAPKKFALAKRSSETSTVLRGRLVDMLTNMQAVRQYARAEYETAAIADLSTIDLKANRESWFYSERMLFANGVIIFIFSSAMFWLLIDGWQNGQVTTGDLVLIMALYAQITGVLVFIGRAFDNIARALGEMKEGLEDLTVPFEVVDAPGAADLVATEASIEWRKVRFMYDEQPIFHDFDLTISAGQRLGLVGPSGAGKTTFVSLLLRQHDVHGGQILIGGQNIAEVTQDSLRRAIAVVPQEPLLFHRSIRENILYGNPDASDEAVIEVAKKAQAHDFIAALPQGYDTLVGERGVKLSGGQKQRVAIARAMLKDAPILVLDEATSALDSESEVAIQKALEVLMEGRTVVAVAHRLSTLRKMDRLIVMESGRIIEDGTHEQLTRAGGVYQRLWEHQAGGFLQD